MIKRNYFAECVNCSTPPVHTHTPFDFVHSQPSTLHELLNSFLSSAHVGLVRFQNPSAFDSVVSLQLRYSLRAFSTV